MVDYQTLSQDDIAAISFLHKTGQAIRAISNQTSVSVCEAKRYMKCVAELGGNKITAKKKTPRNTRETFLCTVRVVHRDVEHNPRVSARKIRQVNLGLLGNVFGRIISRCVYDDLQYLSYAARTIFVVTVAQQEKKLPIL